MTRTISFEKTVDISLSDHELELQEPEITENCLTKSKLIRNLSRTKSSNLANKINKINKVNRSHSHNLLSSANLNHLNILKSCTPTAPLTSDTSSFSTNPACSTISATERRNREIKVRKILKNRPIHQQNVEGVSPSHSYHGIGLGANLAHAKQNDKSGHQTPANTNRLNKAKQKIRFSYISENSSIRTDTMKHTSLFDRKIIANPSAQYTSLSRNPSSVIYDAVASNYNLGSTGETATTTTSTGDVPSKASKVGSKSMIHQLRSLSSDNILCETDESVVKLNPESLSKKLKYPKIRNKLPVDKQKLYQHDNVDGSVGNKNKDHNSQEPAGQDIENEDEDEDDLEIATLDQNFSDAEFEVNDYDQSYHYETVLLNDIQPSNQRNSNLTTTDGRVSKMSDYMFNEMSVDISCTSDNVCEPSVTTNDHSLAGLLSSKNLKYNPTFYRTFYD